MRIFTLFGEIQTLFITNQHRTEPTRKQLSKAQDANDFETFTILTLKKTFTAVRIQIIFPIFASD